MNLAGRVHESGTAIDRHFARALDRELRGVEGYTHVLSTWRRRYVFVEAVTGDVVAAIEAAGGEITGVESGRHTLRVVVAEAAAADEEVSD